MNKRKVQCVIFYCDASKNKCFLLLKTNERREFFWQNVTGSVEADEEFIQAALREAQEETGVAAKNIRSIMASDLTFNFPDRWSEKICEEKTFFIQCKDKWEVTIDESEHSEFKWVKAAEIVKNTVKFESNFIALEKAIKIKC